MATLYRCADGAIMLCCPKGSPIAKFRGAGSKRRAILMARDKGWRI